MGEQFVKPEQVLVNVTASSKLEALKLLAELGSELGIGHNSKGILQAFLDREELGTTGMENGLAIPHAKSDVIKYPAVCLAKFSQPVEWESMDGKPVTIAVALYVPQSDANTTHIRLISKVAVLASRDDFSSFIASTDNPVEIAKYLSEGIQLYNPGISS